MKKILALFLVIVMVFSITSCDMIQNMISGGQKGSVTDSGTTTDNRPPRPTIPTKDINTTQPTTSPTTQPTTKPTTSTSGTTNEPSTHIYVDFTASEKKLFNEVIGDIIPFISNDEYYVEEYSYDYGDEREVGLNYYTFGNTQAEFDAYKEEFSSYVLADSYEDDYGDTWYCYDAPDGSYLVDMSFYCYENTYVVDVYIYCLYDTSSGGDGGSTDTEYAYTDFTADDKALFTQYIGAQIPFIPNNEYYIEGYYDVDDYEHGINFYTIGNTQADFDAYLNKFSSWELYETYQDEYGDTWYCYIKNDVVIDVAYYYDGGYYYVDLYVYSDLSTDIEEGGGTGDSGSGGTGNTNDDVITNEGVGLPSDSDGVFDVDFNKAQYVKKVSDQGYYLDGCPSTGSPAVLVIPVEFSDSKASSKGYTTDKLVNAFGKGGVTDYYSVYDYYYISSYGQLELDITVLDYWFCPQYDSTYYYNATYDYYGDEIAIGDQLVLDEALAYLAGTMDLSQFDSDNNGIIDSVVLINTLDIGEEDFYWAYRYWNIYTDDEGYYYEYDGVSANDYLWASYEFLYESYDAAGNTVYDDTSVMNTYTYIHEFGHILGLDDYYDTAYIGEPMSGCDMMDGMTGDHNAYSKFNLGWLTTSRLVVTDSSVTLTLEDFSKNGDTIILANNWDEKLGAYQEYYVIVYYTNNGLNAGDEYGYFSRDGIVVYHINSSLYKEEMDGEIYYDVYNNNTDGSDQYGTEDNLIEFIKSGEGNFTYVEGDTLPAVTDDNGDALKYTFTVDALTDTTATITFSVK